MLIPAIDLMGGKVVQLVRGEKKALEFDDLDYWIERFAKYPMVQVVDLDAARGTGQNREIIKKIAARLKCQIGGGIRSIEVARTILESGASKVIIGSSLVKNSQIDVNHAAVFAKELGPTRLVFALDSRAGRVSIEGWRKETEVTPLDMIRALESYCETFLYTHIDTEGSMTGIPMEVVETLRQSTSRHLVVAGGIHTQQEIDTLDELKIDAVVGMAVYSGRISA
jgi:phosphoribosylformimino-5-aminoimidazole carboxamide ribotide isomerase